MTASRYGRSPRPWASADKRPANISTILTPPRPLRPRPSQLDPFKDDDRPSVGDRPQGLCRRASASALPSRASRVASPLCGITSPACARHQTEAARSSASNPHPGVQCQIDWGHFGSMAYGDTQRKLYCLAVIECHSRLLYLEFTHSQRQDTLHRCLLNAFHFFQGTPKELVHDNMLTAVLERQGPLVRFNEHFLSFCGPSTSPPSPATWPNPRKRGRWRKAPSTTSGTTSGRCAPFGISPISRPKPTSGATRWPMSGSTRTTGQPPTQRFDPKAMRRLTGVVTGLP